MYEQSALYYVQMTKNAFISFILISFFIVDRKVYFFAPVQNLPNKSFQIYIMQNIARTFWSDG